MHFSSFFPLLLFKTCILELEAISKLIYSFAPLLSSISGLREGLLISSAFIIIIITARNISYLEGKPASAIKVKVMRPGAQCFRGRPCSISTERQLIRMYV